VLPLSDSTLPRLARRLDAPTYDRAALTPSIVHIGVGGFHRAHQAVYLDELARAGVTAWGEVGVSLRTPALREAMHAQDGLFSVVELGGEGERARVIGSMTQYLFGPDDPRAVVDRLAAPTTRIVTLTVTGDGYALPGSGAARGSAATWADYAVSALARRRVNGAGGCTVLSCDNLAESGRAARAALLTRAAARDQTLARWVERHVSFPDAMVDRITPGTDDELQRMMARRYGIHDRSPVATEAFRQWVVEDDFCQGRPPLEQVGVQVVADVAPYKLVKTRLLNGTHTAMAYLGRLAGYRTTADLVANPVLRSFVSELMRREVAPHLPAVPGTDIEEYIATVLERLANKGVADPLDRLCRRGSTKVPAYLLPALADATRNGERAPLLTLALAGWFRYLRGSDASGAPLRIEDALLDELQPLALAHRTDPTRLLGHDLLSTVAHDPRIHLQVRAALRDLEHGVEPAIQRALTSGGRRLVVVPRQRGQVAPEPGLIS
jgi:mannitol 2-dehydrogenase